MKIKQYEICIADLNPGFGTEAGKTRPVIIMQTDLLNKFYPSTIICPVTKNTKPDARILRVPLVKGTSNLREDCDILIDQLPAIDNKRLLRKTGGLNQQQIKSLRRNLLIILDLQDELLSTTGN